MAMIEKGRKRTGNDANDGGAVGETPSSLENDDEPAMKKQTTMEMYGKGKLQKLY